MISPPDFLNIKFFLRLLFVNKLALSDPLCPCILYGNILGIILSKVEETLTLPKISSVGTALLCRDCCNKAEQGALKPACVAPGC